MDVSARITRAHSSPFGRWVILRVTSVLEKLRNRPFTRPLTRLSADHRKRRGADRYRDPHLPVHRERVYRLNEGRGLRILRKQRDAARQQWAQGVNPAAERQRKRNPIDRFSRGGCEGLVGMCAQTGAGRKAFCDACEKVKSQLESYMIPELGRENVNSIRPSRLLPVLKRIEAKAC